MDDARPTSIPLAAAIAGCIYATALFVGLLYVRNAGKSRADPVTIRSRMISVAFASALAWLPLLLDIVAHGQATTGVSKVRTSIRVGIMAVRTSAAAPTQPTVRRIRQSCQADPHSIKRCRAWAYSSHMGF
jgi:hypothetical protein